MPLIVAKVVLSDLLLLELQLDADLVAVVGLVELEQLHGLGVHEDAAVEELKGCVPGESFVLRVTA